MADTYTYNLASDIGKVRLLTFDTDLTSVAPGTPPYLRSAVFTDEEYQAFLDMEPSIDRAAALALRATSASKQLLIVARRNGKGEVDYGNIRKDLLALAQAYEDRAAAAPADATAEQAWTDFGARRIVINAWMRRD